MKKISWGVLALSVMSLLITSCKDNDNDQWSVSRIIGDILPKDGGQMRILLDDCDTVMITNSDDIDRSKLEVNRLHPRVLAHVEVISTKKTGDYNFYEARNVIMDSLLTKLPVMQSFLDSDTPEGNDLNEEIGDDFIFIHDAQIDARYLTVIYGITHGGNGISHFINLLIDDTTEPIVNANGVLEIKAELKHNAFNDLNIQSGNGYVSFDIEKYMKMEGVKEIEMEVEFAVSNGNTNTKTISWKNDNQTAKPLASKMNANMSIYKMAR